MGFQCVPQFVALTYGTPRNKKIKVAGDGKEKEEKEVPPRHRANGVYILMEMAEERATSSETFDRTRSSDNEYWSVLGDNVRGEDTWDYMVDECFGVKQKVTMKDGTVHERARRKDTIVGVATIIKPPAEVVQTWTPEQLRRFYEDAEEVLEEIDPELFRPETKRFEAMHADEGGCHFHDARQAVDRDGKYIGSRVESRKWLGQVNQNFYKGMRDRGWDVEKPDYMVEEDYEKDKTYRAKRKAKWDKSGGRSVNDYKQQQLKERTEKAAQMESDALQMYGDAKAALETIDEELAAQRAAAQAEIDKELAAQRAAAQAEIAEMKTAAQVEIDTARAKLEADKQEVRAVYAQVKQQQQNMSKTVDAAVKRRDNAATADESACAERESRAKKERELPDTSDIHF